MLCVFSCLQLAVKQCENFPIKTGNLSHKISILLPILSLFSDLLKCTCIWPDSLLPKEMMSLSIVNYDLS